MAEAQATASSVSLDHAIHDPWESVSCDIDSWVRIACSYHAVDVTDCARNSCNLILTSASDSQHTIKGSLFATP